MAQATNSHAIFRADVNVQLEHKFDLDWAALLIGVATEFRIALDQTTPVNKTPVNAQSGHFEVGGVQFMRTSPGTLKRSHRFRILKGKMAVELTNKQPYAVIQNYGGVIPALDLRAGTRATRIAQRILKKSGKRSAYGARSGSSAEIMAIPTAGGLIFRTKRGPITIKKQEYVERAVDIAVPKVRAQWSPEPGGQAVAA